MAKDGKEKNGGVGGARGSGDLLPLKSLNFRNLEN